MEDEKIRKMNPSNLRKNFADDLLEKKLSTYDKQLSIEGDLNLKKLAKPVEGKYTNTLNNIILFIIHLYISFYQPVNNHLRITLIVSPI